MRIKGSVIMIWEVVNLVMVAHTRQTIPLEKLGEIAGAEYDPKIYHGVVAYYWPIPCGPKVSIFKTGQMIVAGRIDPKIGKTAIRKTVRVMCYHGLIHHATVKPHIVNIVVLANLQRPVNLDKIALHLDNSICEPEQFPGLIHRPPSFRPQSFTIFASGKAIIAGISEPKFIVNSIEYLRKTVEELGE
jgi:transcription initiation factor TFIID TATA-box-binding protein